MTGESGFSSCVLSIVLGSSWDHLASYPIRAWASFAGGKESGTELTTHLHILPHVRMHGAVPTFIYTSAICGAKLSEGTMYASSIYRHGNKE